MLLKLSTSHDLANVRKQVAVVTDGDRQLTAHQRYSGLPTSDSEYWKDR